MVQAKMLSFPAKSSHFFAKSSNMSSAVLCSQSKQLCGDTPKCPPESELPQAFHYNCRLGAVGRKSGTEAALCRGTWMCMLVCHYQWFKQICSTGPAAEYCESHIRIPGSQLHTHSEADFMLKHTSTCTHTHTPPRCTLMCLAMQPPHWSSCTLRPFHLSLPLAGWR